MRILIENYKKTNIDFPGMSEHGNTIKTKLDRIYERSPYSSVFFIFAQKNEEGNFSLELKITSLSQKFHFLGKHHCLKEAFVEGVTSLQNQISSWNKNRFQPLRDMDMLQVR